MLPNKLISYRESIVPKTLLIWSLIENNITILELYKKIKNKLDYVDFIFGLELLYCNDLIIIERGEVIKC